MTERDEQGSDGHFVADAERLAGRDHARDAAESLTPIIVAE